MSIFGLVRDYVVWHYSRAYVDIFYLWKNYLWFINHIFSVPEVAMSWLSPFKRIQEKKVNFIAHPEEFFSNMFVNLMMRIVGVIIRSALLMIACSFFALFGVVGVMFFVVWTALPVLIVHFLVTSIRVLFI